MIKVKDLIHAYFKGDTLFSGVSFVLSGQDKVGLVGPNGCGKSTLLKLLAGIEAKTDGLILLESEKVGYLPQELDLPEDMLLGEYFENLSENTPSGYLVGKYKSELDLAKCDEYQLIATLSGGEKLKLKLMEVLLDSPTSLLLDEPTNHLDIEGILWFETFVKKFQGNVLMISHDRSFLNNTVNKIFEIENKEFHIFEGNYDSYIGHKKEFIEKRNEEYTRFLKKKAQLEQLVGLAHKIGGGKPSAVQAAKSRYAREIEQNVKEEYKTSKIEGFGFEGSVHRSKLIVEAKEIRKSFGKREVLKDVSFEIRGGDKVWLYGPNGVGKSTLVKILIGEYGQDSGELKLGANLKVGYFAQANDALDYDATLYDYFLSESGLSYGQIYGVLKKFLFDKEMTKMKIKSLSPGQRARLKLALFSMKDYDFLILDEPTNHLDIAAKEVIEEALRNYKGTLLLVSHDRYFVSEVEVDKVFELISGKVKEKYFS